MKAIPVFVSILACFGVFLILPSYANAADQIFAPDAMISNFDDLKNLIQSSGVKSLDQLMDLLPAKMKANTILVYKSQALHQELVTPQTPRMLFFSDDGSLAFSISRSLPAAAVARGEDVMEIVNFDKTKHVFETHVIPFDGISNPLNQMSSPVTCVRCHGENPRPMFQDYNAWPGTYGSFSEQGVSAVGTKEYQNLESFLASINIAESDPRYKKLDLSHITKTSSGYKYFLNTPKGVYEPTPANKYGIAIEPLMWERLAAKIMQEKFYAELKPLLYYLGAKSTTCGTENQRLHNIYHSFIPKMDQAKMEQILEKIRLSMGHDLNFKTKLLEEYNKPALDIDVRGMLSGPSMETYVQHDPFYQIDYLLMDKKYIVFEALLEKFKLSTADFSTYFPQHWSLGIHQAGEVEDDSVFGNWLALLGYELIKLDTSLAPNFENCQEAKDAAKKALVHLKVPNPDHVGVMYK